MSPQRYASAFASFSSRACGMLLATLLAAAAQAAPNDELEPAVATSSAARSPAPAAPGVAPAASPAMASPPSTAGTSGTAGAAGTAGKSQTPAAPAAPASPTGSVRTSAAPQDRIELETTQISGNRELPKVMYVVPWRKPDLGDFSGRPPNSLLDEALTPLDRDVFRRQNRYYASLASQAGGAATPAAASGDAGAAPVGPVGKDEK